MDLAMLEDEGFALLRMPKHIETGSTVTARLYDGRVVVAKVTAVVDSVLGRKIHISFGAFAFKVDETQIIRVVPWGDAQVDSLCAKRRRSFHAVSRARDEINQVGNQAAQQADYEQYQTKPQHLPCPPGIFIRGKSGRNTYKTLFAEGI
jgi:hypothetical protein